MWNDKKINLFLDISTYCNAGCPQCHRTNPNGLGKCEWLPLVQWNLDDFKRAFPLDELKNVNNIKICGTFGEPIMNKDILEICEYVINNTEINISLDTNGSIRDEDWWWDFGVIGGKQLSVVFAIDGITQNMHEKYRRFTILDKVLSNMHMLSQTNAIVRSQTVLFKHNQNYKKELMELVKKYGSVSHSFVTSDRFYKGPKFEFVNENGETDYLEEVETSLNSKNCNKAGDIICKWALPRNEVVINVDGQVLPCCYHANPHYLYRNKDKNSVGFIMDHPLYKDIYNKSLKDYNVFYTPLNEILTSQWFNKLLPESFSSDTPIQTCELNCSNRIMAKHQARESFTV